MRKKVTAISRRISVSAPGGLAERRYTLQRVEEEESTSSSALPTTISYGRERKTYASLRFPRYRGEDIVIPGISRCFRKKEALGPAFLVSQVGRGNEGDEEGRKITNQSRRGVAKKVSSNFFPTLFFRVFKGNDKGKLRESS